MFNWKGWDRPFNKAVKTRTDGGRPGDKATKNFSGDWRSLLTIGTNQYKVLFADGQVAMPNCQKLGGGGTSIMTLQLSY